MTERLRLSEHNRRWWTLGAMSFALFMVMLALGWISLNLDRREGVDTMRAHTRVAEGS